MCGGGAGANGRAVLNPDTPRERTLPKIDVLELTPGDVLSIRTPGGGGHGDPLDRPIVEVRADVEAGLVTTARARDAYAVVMAGDAVDAEATTALRATRRAARGAPRARSISARLAMRTSDAGRPLSRTPSSPFSWRSRCRIARGPAARSIPRVGALADRGPVTVADLARLWRELATVSGLSPDLAGAALSDATKGKLS